MIKGNNRGLNGKSKLFNAKGMEGKYRTMGDRARVKEGSTIASFAERRKPSVTSLGEECLVESRKLGLLGILFFISMDFEEWLNLLFKDLILSIVFVFD